MIFGLVLAGGRSSRFGREKAVADLAGRPLIAHVTAVLAAGCTRVAVNARAGTGAAAFAQAHDHEVVEDAAADPDGPLSGVKAGLLWAKAEAAEYLATSPCDTPFIPGDLVARLAAATEPGRPTVARTADGLQPLCALWPVSCTDDLAAILGDGRHPAIKEALAALNAVEVAFEAAWRFDNLNTPGDYQAALALRRPT